ncbi:MAG: dephospho-CoA kinase [Planctomycetota bacterium]
MWTIGITGHVAAGKSAVASYLESLGCLRVDADALARESFTDPKVLQALRERFGDSIFLPAQTQVDRAELAKQVFGESAASRHALGDLNEIVHPWVRQRMLQTLREHAAGKLTANDLDSGDLEASDLDSGDLEASVHHVRVLDVPLLIESGWVYACDEVWCVTADDAILLSRARDRGWPEGEWQRRTARQVPISRKRSLATRIIDNGGNLHHLHRQIDRAMLQMRKKISEMSPDDHCW